MLEKAISDWLKKEGDAINEQGEEILDVHKFANKLGTPPQTFYKYICMDNHRIQGDGGRKSWQKEVDDKWRCLICRVSACSCRPTK